MKRLGLIVAVGAVLIGMALPAAAQQPNFTVTFGGQMRVYGLTWDNFTDFADTDKSNPVEDALGIPPTRNKDSESYFFQRWRLFTTVESADKNAKVVWAIEVGDVTWGLGGGASGAEYGGITTRVGPSQGGGFGSDGVNVETKNLYLQFNIPFVPNANLLLGAHNTVFMTSPAGAFMDDDGWGIQFNWKADPVDLQVYGVKIDENTRASADDNDMYAVRLGINITPDIRATVEGMVVSQQCYARRAAVAPAVGSCVSSDFGDTFWIGSTVGAKVASINLHGSFVYGERALFSAANSASGIGSEQIEESGFGVQLTAQVPIGPVSTWWHAWYTTGDESRINGGGCADVTTHPQCGSAALAAQGIDLSTRANTTNLRGDSDKLPIPDTGASWSSVPYVLEFTKGLASLGAPGFGSTHYSDSTGTWGIGGSASYALTPALSLGGGVGYMSETDSTGVYGDQLVEFDAGLVWRFNPNLTISGLFGYAVPDEGDDAWAAVFRTQFSF